ncbi:hypothetical protein Hanom_Chr01g00043461 [Helianthus anomalus]
MAEPSNPHNVEGENPDRSTPAAGEDEDDGGATSGGGLPVLKWSKGGFDTLMTSIQMPREFGATYPEEGDTGVDAPTGCLTPWAEFFYDGNLRLPLTVFVSEVLEFYQIHISQLSPFGMFWIRNFEYTFRALGLEVSVENFWRFYQLTVNTGFFSFNQRIFTTMNQRYGGTKLMTPPKGVTKWKTKFFYVKVVAVAPKMAFRNVNETIPTEDVALPTVKSVDWFPRLKPIELKRLNNSQLWVLRMILSRPDRRARPVVREKSGADAPLWRMFEPDFEGKVELLPCGEGEGFNLDIVGNFRVPTWNLGALGKFEVKSIPKKHAEKKHAEKLVRGRPKKKPEATIESSSVGHAAGAGTAAGGTAAGSKPAGEKRKPEEKVVGAGEIKRRKIQTKRVSGVAQKKPAVISEPQQEDFSSLFDVPSSPPHDKVADAGVNKEFVRSPSLEAVENPSARAEGTVEKSTAQIFDTVDSSNNLISPTDGDDLNLRFSGAEKNKASAGEKASGSASRGAGVEENPIQPEESELKHYYRTYTEDRAVNYHRPPGALCKGMTFRPSLLLARRFWVVWAPRSKLTEPVLCRVSSALGRKEEENARLRAEAEELVKTAHEGAERLEREKAAFEKHKQTEEWVATAELKQVRTLAKLLSDERKSWEETLSNERKTWKESWAKQNENMFRVRQELANVKAVNATLVKVRVACRIEI